MDDLQAIAARITAYADYHDETARHLADEQVRAWAGEAISRLRERLAPFGDAVNDQFDELLLICEFTDQVLMRILNHLALDSAGRAQIHGVDRALVETADGADRIAAASEVGPFLSGLRERFAERTRLIESLAPRRA